MPRGSRIFILLIVILGIFVISANDTFVLAQTYPETVRVGLYFGSSSVSSVDFSSRNGLEVGYYQNGQFSLLYAETGGKQVILRKDAYFVKTGTGSFSEYKPSEGIPFSGETTGPYHIQIGKNVPDLPTALALADAFKAKGVAAYTAYDNGWAVWTGFYADSNLARDDFQTLSTKLGISDLTVIEPTIKRIIIYNSKFEPLLIFGSNDLKLTVRPNSQNNPRVLSVNGKQYRGEIEVRRFSDGDMTVINVINIEEYLYGVVPREIEASSPIEALKAQAVAARTFTYMSMGKYKKWDFDVVNTTDSQVYGGFDAEKPASNQAVDDTRGQKILYNGSLASVHYFSSSGGATEDYVNVWGSEIPYLKSVIDPFEAGTSYNYNWSRIFTTEDIKMKLVQSGVDIGDILSMTAEEYTPAGRVNKLKIIGTKGSITYHKEDIRRILGDSAYLPSRMFTISSGGSSGGASGVVSVVSSSGSSTIGVFGSKAVTSSGAVEIKADNGAVKIVGANNSAVITGSAAPGTFVLTGKGWGHAVGMSQEGAKGFARNGYTYDQILKHYFTGVTVE